MQQTAWHHAARLIRHTRRAVDAHRADIGARGENYSDTKHSRALRACKALAPLVGVTALWLLYEPWHENDLMECACADIEKRAPRQAEPDCWEVAV